MLAYTLFVNIATHFLNQILLGSQIEFLDAIQHETGDAFVEQHGKELSEGLCDLSRLTLNRSICKRYRLECDRLRVLLNHLLDVEEA